MSQAFISPAAEEIEIFNRRYIPIFLFILDVTGYGIIYFRSVPDILAIKSWFLWIFFFTLILLIVHFVYTIVLLVAPRFLYRGTVWLKTSPWILSSLGVSVILCCFIKFSLSRLITCASLSFLQILQYSICVTELEQPISFLFKPFEKKIILNFLAKVNLTNQNFNLDDYFGPPIIIPSTYPGQSPSIIRYGSQANPKPSNINGTFNDSQAPPAYNHSIQESSFSLASSSSSQSQFSIHQIDVKK